MRSKLARPQVMAISPMIGSLRRWVSSTPALLLFFFLGFYSLTSAGRLDAIDGIVVAQTAQSIAFGRTLAVPTGTLGQTIGVGGLSYSKYGIAQSLVEIPFALLGRVLKHFTGLSLMMGWSIALTNTFVTAIGCVVFYLLVRALGARERRAIALTLLYGICTLAWAYAKTDFNEPLQTTALLLAAYALRRAHMAYNSQAAHAERWVLLGGMALAVAVLTKSFLLAVAVPAFVIYAACALLRGPTGTHAISPLSRLRDRRWWWALLRQQAVLWAPIVVACIITLLLNVARFGNLFDFGYGRVSGDKPFTGPILTGLYGLAISPNAGLLFYATPIVLGIWGFARFARRLPAEAVLVGLLTVSMFIFYGGYFYWEGLSAYGPRYLVPLVPFLLLPAVDTFPHVLRDGLRSGLRQPRVALLLGFLCLVAILGAFEQVLAVVVNFRIYTAMTCSTYPCPSILDPTQSEGLYHLWLFGAAFATSVLGRPLPTILPADYPFGTAPHVRATWQTDLNAQIDYFWYNPLPDPLLWVIVGLVVVGIPTTVCLVALLRRLRAADAVATTVLVVPAAVPDPLEV